MNTQEIRAALEAATPGPWRVETNNLGREVVARERDSIARFNEPRWPMPGTTEEARSDQAAVAAEGLANETLTILLRNAAPALLARIDALEALILDADTVARRRGDAYGLCDAIDNHGKPYPSAWAAGIVGDLRAARALLSEARP